MIKSVICLTVNVILFHGILVSIIKSHEGGWPRIRETGDDPRFSVRELGDGQKSKGYGR